MDNNMINDIRKSVDIVSVISHYIPLVSRGKNYFGVCPFHDDHSPSMSVSKEKQIFTCFSCGATGNVFTFVSDYEHIGISLKMLYEMYSRKFLLVKGPDLSAAAIKREHDIIIRKCEEFAAVPDNMEYIKTAKDILSVRTDNPVEDYWNAYWLIKELEEKDFLYCFPDSKIREDYCLLRHYCAELYGGYTSSVR